MNPGNRDYKLMESQVRIATNNSGIKLNDFMAGIHVVLDVTVNAGTAASITLTIQGFDASSGQYYTLLASSAVTAVGTTVYKIFPGAPVTTNVSVNDIVPYKWRVLVTHGNANPITYTVGASLITV